jgi:hypothetical protein
MRHFDLIILFLIAAVYFFMVAAVNDDIKWFHNFSTSNNKERQQTFKSFDFSYNNVFSTCFSIKFTQSDSVFIKQHFAPAFSCTAKSGQSYFAILSDIDRHRLDSFIFKTNFAGFDTSYYQDFQDGEDYQFFVDKDSTQKIIYVHSDSIPNVLKSFGHWIVNLKKNLKLFTIDTVVNFGSVRHFLPLSAPTPTIKFTPPKVK